MPSLQPVIVAAPPSQGARWLEETLRRIGERPQRLDPASCLERARLEGELRLVLLDSELTHEEATSICAALRASPFAQYVCIIGIDRGELAGYRAAMLERGADACVAASSTDAELAAQLTAARRILALDDELRRRHRSAELKAMRDPLTGIWGRATILEHLARELERARRTGGCVGTVMLDVDHFKQINDRYGHLVGDDVLVEVAKRLADSVRCYDAVGRYGGEEFLVVLSCRTLDEVCNAAERIRGAIHAMDFTIDGHALRVSASVGVVAADGSTSLRDAIRHADEALYRAKDNGRNCVVLSTIPPAPTDADAETASEAAFPAP